MMPPGASSFFAGSRKQPMKVRRDAGPLAPEELIALRKLLHARRAEPTFSPAQVATLCGFRNKRTVLDLVKAGKFPHAFKPAANVLRIPESDVVEFQESRRVRKHGADARTGALEEES